MMHGHGTDAGLPPLTVTDLRAVNLVLPALERATVTVSAPGGGKRHVPEPPGTKPYNRACRNSPDGAGVAAVLITVLPEVCKRCRHRLDVPAPVGALWEVAVRIVAAHARLGKLRACTRAPSWSGYAAALATAPAHEHSTVTALLDTVRPDPVYGTDRDRLAQAWARVTADWETLLGEYRRAAPDADLTAAASAACDEVTTDPALRKDSDLLSRIIGDVDGWSRPHFLAGLVIEAWKVARGRGDTPERCLSFALTAAERHLAGRAVRDVSLLPTPARTAYAGERSVGAWAEREFDHLWREAATHWVQLLEDAYRGPGGPGREEQRLILVANWPLTRPADRDLAYLAQYPQHGPALPAGRRPHAGDYGPWGWEPAWSVVLAVPAFAAAHAAELTERRRDQQITVGPAPDDDPQRRAAQVLALARTAYPYLADDAAADGTRARPTRMVLRARAERRPAPSNVIRLHPTPHVSTGSHDEAWAWCEGRISWIPDDSATETTAATALTAMLSRIYRTPPMRVLVETGRRPATSIHSLAGDLTSVDLTRREIAFAPLGGHATLRIPLRRIIAITGDNHRGDLAELDAGWAPYPPPGRHGSSHSAPDTVTAPTGPSCTGPHRSRRPPARGVSGLPPGRAAGQLRRVVPAAPALADSDNRDGRPAQRDRSGGCGAGPKTSWSCRRHSSRTLWRRPGSFTGGRHLFVKCRIPPGEHAVGEHLKANSPSSARPATGSCGSATRSSDPAVVSDRSDAACPPVGWTRTAERATGASNDAEQTGTGR
ncbi:hypothetical protein [Amycolatopsis magusensis]|uniref:Uncharacterized protein n=1 Tax=Amycolatopsis magusensis TaxID=882444 RepID=A0ABS4PWS6_9PSEU|nr:hypothetical protein [Amycolatopsis magusensis]MBP2183882.1 hypothetical protein [Amycolatopsis magusensis]